MTKKGIAEKKQKIKDDDSFERGLAEDKDNAMSELKIELKTSKDTMAKLKEKIGEVYTQHNNEKSLNENEKNIQLQKLEITISEM